jgi:hypothetical protein
VTVFVVFTVPLCFRAFPAEDLVLRPQPQIIQPSEGGFTISPATRILIPKGWPAYVRVSAKELANVVNEVSGTKPGVVESETLDVRKSDIIVAPYEWLTRRLGFIEPMPQGIIRPAPSEGYNIRVVPDHLLVAGNSERGCFMGLQTLIQTARQTEVADGEFTIPGFFISDWPDHPWRTLQHPFGVYGSAYDRGEHRYRHVTKVDLLERSIRLAAYHKLTGLGVEVGTGMIYERHPEIFVEGFATNTKEGVKGAVDLAKSLGLDLTPFQNVSAGHDIWTGPYAYAVPNSDIYMEELFDIFDETLEVFRPSHLHIGMDEDVARDFDENLLRSVEMHKQVILDCYEFLLRRGVATMVWNDGVDLLREGKDDLPRDIIVLPWYYGGMDFTHAQRYIDTGFRILCSPWSQWHVENDQFYSICASTIKSDELLGMWGTIWYPIHPDGENDYRRCVVKAAMAFWSPLRAGDYPEDKEYFAPEYSDLPPYSPSQTRPAAIPKDELQGLIQIVTGAGDDHFACENARERLVGAGTSSVPDLLKAMSENPDNISPWAEGTLRRIAREPLGDTSVMIAALEVSATQAGALGDLCLEMLGSLRNSTFLARQDADNPAVCLAMGMTNDSSFLPILLKSASQEGPAQANALLAIGRLRGLRQLLSLRDSWRGFDDEAREAYAKALAMQASDEAIPLLGELIRDESWRVRFRAAIGLGATRSKEAGPHILKILDDDSPAVLKVGLYWCTDTFILEPAEYFPTLISRLNLEEDKEIVRPVLHAMILMWDSRLGQWLSKVEDKGERLDYPSLKIWRGESLTAALNHMISYEDPRLVMDVIMVLIKMDAALDTESVLRTLERFAIEDKRWFCVKMRDYAVARAAPIMKKLWSNDDHLVRTFILQYCERVVIPETFEIAYSAYNTLPAESEQLKAMAVGAVSSHVERLDDTAKKAVPLILEHYPKADINTRANYDKSLARAAGREPFNDLADDEEEINNRLQEWKKWWEKAEAEMD